MPPPPNTTKRPNQRKRTRKRKRREVSSSSSSSSSSDSDSDSSGSKAQAPASTRTTTKASVTVSAPTSTTQGVASESSSSDSDSDSSDDSSSSTSSSESEDEDTATAALTKAATSASNFKQTGASGLDTKPEKPGRIPRIPSPPPRNNVSVPPLLTATGGEAEKEKGIALRARFRQFWMGSVAEAFADDLNEIRKEPNMTPSRLGLLIDSLAAGADVYWGQSTGPDDGSVTNEMEVVLGE